MGFKIKAADGTTIEIQDGEYYFNTKARGRQMMLNSLSSDARRVYACLELATMGFQQELAVTMERGEQRPLTPADIRRQTGLLKQNVNRGLVELEDEGLAIRKSDDGGPLRNGHMLIFSWAVPRPPRIKSEGNRARLPFPDWFPDSWAPLKPYINRYKYSLTTNEGLARDYLERGAELARDYQNLEKELARFFEPIRAEAKKPRPSLYGKNRNNGIERKAAAASPVVERAAAAPPAPILVAEELSIDLEAATQIVTECMGKDPSLTAEEIVEVGRIKDQSLSRQEGVRSRTAILKKTIPEMCRGGTLRDVRARLEATKQEKQEYEARRGRAREAWPQLGEIERAEVLLRYPELRAEIGDFP